MINPVAAVIGAIDTRIRRLEESIGSATDSIISFMSVTEDIGVADYVYIYQIAVNDTFLLGHGILGVTEIGDRRDAPELIYSG